MQNRHIPPERILSKLDEYLHRNDYASAVRHLLYWLGEAEQSGDGGTELTVRNELMGLYRKLGRGEEALACVEAALDKINKMNIGDQVGSATTYLNSATVYKAFGRAEDAIPLFEHARSIYEKNLAPDDGRLGGLYNNMALALVDLGRFEEAKELYAKAISVMEKQDGGELEVAITYLNLATAAEAELGLENADEPIQKYLELAESLLEGFERRDGYYAFVCEKCASVFGYYGWFVYENELKERSKRIYEGN
jgi:tetratricopeptide (TPR) repeat protein